MSKNASKKSPATGREVLDRKKAKRATISIVLDSELLVARDEAREEVDEVRSAATVVEARPGASEEMKAEAAKKLAAAERKLARAEAAAEAATVVFEFQAIGGAVMERLLREHAPSLQDQAEEQKRAKRMGERPRQLAYSEASFPPVLIAECCVSPGFTVEEAQELWESDAWNDSERDALFGVAWALNKMV